MKPIPQAQNRQTSEQAENESYKHGNHCAQHYDSIKACEVSRFKILVGKSFFHRLFAPVLDALLF
jgi:hypothetical protein